MLIKFNKEGLIPVIIQDFLSFQVLMLGYMNEESLNKTIKEKVVTFFSRSKKRLWKKGETSGNFLLVKEVTVDCDLDTILIKVNPLGMTCHKNQISCFANISNKGFIYKLQHIISKKINQEDYKSYTYSLHNKGINKIAQKVGEEAVELIIESKDNNKNLFLNEAADLLYHYLMLLHKKEVIFEDIENILQMRNSTNKV